MFVVAGLVMAAIVAAVVLLNPVRTPKITIVKTDVFAPHTVFQQQTGGIRVLGDGPAAEDDLYIVATVRIVNRLPQPIALNGCTAALINPDGTQLNATAIAPRDLVRIEQIFPALAPMAQHPLDEETPLAAGATREGNIVLQFPGLSATAWNGRKSASLTINLINQAPQVLIFRRR
jgi:hypothetical protein